MNGSSMAAVSDFFALARARAPRQACERDDPNFSEAAALSDTGAKRLSVADVRRSYARITSAPCVIVVCLTMEDMDVYPDARRAEAEHLMAVQGVALAIQNLLQTEVDKELVVTMA